MPHLNSDDTLDATRSIFGGPPLEATTFPPCDMRDGGARTEFGPSTPALPSQKQVEAGWKSAFARVQASR